MVEVEDWEEEEVVVEAPLRLDDQGQLLPEFEPQTGVVEEMVVGTARRSQGTKSPCLVVQSTL